MSGSSGGREQAIADAWAALGRKRLNLDAESAEDLRQEVALACLESWAASGGNGEDVDGLVAGVVGRFLRREGAYRRRFKLVGGVGE